MTRPSPSPKIAEEEAELGLQPEGFYSFPTLEQLSEVSEEALRADGYGYRAKYIVGAVKALQAYPQGGHEWLMVRACDLLGMPSADGRPSTPLPPPPVMSLEDSSPPRPPWS